MNSCVTLAKCEDERFINQWRLSKMGRHFLCVLGMFSVLWKTPMSILATEWNKKGYEEEPRENISDSSGWRRILCYTHLCGIDEMMDSVQRFCTFNKVVPKKLARRRSSLNVNLQGRIDKIAKQWGNRVPTGKIWSAGRCDEINGLNLLVTKRESIDLFRLYPEWILIQIRRLSFDHLYRHDSQRPDINFWSILLTAYYFGCHPKNNIFGDCILQFITGTSRAFQQVLSVYFVRN